MSIEEFADYIEEEPLTLTLEEQVEEKELLNREFQENNFIPEDFLSPDWYPS